MPARPRPVDAICAAAAVVVYVECQKTKLVRMLPADGKPEGVEVVILRLAMN